MSSVCVVLGRLAICVVRYSYQIGKPFFLLLDHLTIFSIGLSLSFVLLKDYFIVCIVKGLSYHLCCYCTILPFVLLLHYLAIFVAATKSYYLYCLVILLHVFIVFWFIIISLYHNFVLTDCLTMCFAEGLSYHLCCWRIILPFMLLKN